MEPPDSGLADPHGIFPLFLQHSGAALAIKDLSGRYVYANEGYGLFAQRDSAELIGRSDEEIFHPDRVEALLAAQAEAKSQLHAATVDEVLMLEEGTAQFNSTHFPILDEQQRLVAVGVVALQVSLQRLDSATAEQALELAEQTNASLARTVRELEEQALTDTLTGAWNRRRFEECAVSEIHRAARECQPISLVMVDIDHFKSINDALGHEAGDNVLVELVELLKGALRKSDSVTRWGGEEFLLLLPNTGLDAAASLAERIRVQVEGHAFRDAGRVTASFGVAEFSPMESWRQWVRRADDALYEAKNSGRNRVASSVAPAADAEAEDRPDGSLVKLRWKDRFKSGHAAIDSQHENLVRVANALLVAVLSSRSNGHVLDLSVRLIEDLEAHFEFEEALLRDLDYPCLDSHQEEHRALVRRARSLAASFRNGEVAAHELIQFLAYELTMRHMLGTDRHYFSFLPGESAQA